MLGIKGAASTLKRLALPMGGTDRSMIKKMLLTIREGLLLTVSRKRHPAYREWNEVQYAWGIQEPAVKRRVISGLKVERGLMCAMMAVGLLVASNCLRHDFGSLSFLLFLCFGLLFSLVGLGRAAVAQWYLDVIHGQKWVAFPDWIMGRTQEQAVVAEQIRTGQSE